MYLNYPTTDASLFFGRYSDFQQTHDPDQVMNTPKTTTIQI